MNNPFPCHLSARIKSVLSLQIYNSWVSAPQVTQAGYEEAPGYTALHRTSVSQFHLAWDWGSALGPLLFSSTDIH